MMDVRCFCFLVILMTLVLGCKEVLLEQEFSLEDKRELLIIYSDSTYTIEIDNVKKSGKWNGGINQRDTFRILIDHSFKTHLNISRYFKVLDKNIIPIEQKGYYSGWKLNSFINFDQIKKVSITNVNGRHYLKLDDWNFIQNNIKYAKSVGGIRCKPSGPCLNLEFKNGEVIQGCVCGDLINFESSFYGSFKITKKINFHNY